MNKNFKIILPVLFLVVLMLETSCKKSPLDQPYNEVLGQYEWTQTSYKETAFSTNKYKYPDQQNTAGLEFLKNRKIKFFINGNEVGSGTFNVKEEHANDTGFSMDIKIKVKEGSLEINNEITVILTNSDSLSFSGFPYPSYNNINANSYENHFIRK